VLSLGKVTLVYLNCVIYLVKGKLWKSIVTVFFNHEKGYSYFKDGRLNGRIIRMKIITQAIRVIDYENNKVLSRKIMPKFGEYIEQLVFYINENSSVREYKTQSTGTEVIGGILQIIEYQTDDEIVLRKINMMAERLLKKEREAQEQVANMDIKVQKGSLILALIEDEGNLLFLLAKVEHTDFFDDTDYSIKSGFSKDTKKIWKTCLFEIDDVTSKQFCARVYSNTVAKYWWHDFLELEELQSDESNTKRSFKAVENTLNRNLKKVAPYDHMVIRNAIYLYFSSVEQFDFSEMIDKTVRNYTSNDMTAEKKEELLQKLQTLPEEQHFDYQFRPALSVIKPKMRKTYDVYSGIQIKVTNAIENLGNIIEAYQAKDGNRYLRIRVDNEATFRTFEHKGED
jgi:hypothetical protein